MRSWILFSDAKFGYSIPDSQAYWENNYRVYYFLLKKIKIPNFWEHIIQIQMHVALWKRKKFVGNKNSKLELFNQVLFRIILLLLFKI